MTDEQTGLNAEGAVLEVLSNEGWVADPDATEYNLRVARLVLAATRASTVPLDVELLETAIKNVTVVLGREWDGLYSGHAPNIATEYDRLKGSESDA